MPSALRLWQARMYSTLMAPAQPPDSSMLVYTGLAAGMIYHFGRIVESIAELEEALQNYGSTAKKIGNIQRVTMHLSHVEWVQVDDVHCL